MRIGLSYDLRSEYLAAGYDEVATAEFDRDDTIEAIEAALAALGHTPERIGNVHALNKALAAGRRWDLVFNIAEGLYGFAREAQVPALLEAFQIPSTFSDALTSALTLHKGLTKSVVRDHGIATAAFTTIANMQDLATVNLRYPLFAKPVAEGTGKGVDGASRVGDPAELARVCARLLETYRQPVLIEEYLPGREFTAGIVGTGERARVVGGIEIKVHAASDPGIYSYHNKEEWEHCVRYERMTPGALKTAIDTLALSAWRCLGCRDGGRVDVRLDASDRPCFLEVNPLAGLHPRHSDLPIICTMEGIAYQTLIGWIVESAETRISAPQVADSKAA